MVIESFEPPPFPIDTLQTYKRISIVIPALNEEDGITQTITAIPVDELLQLGYETEILVVDNGSEDRTAELATKAGARVVSEPTRGYGRAYKSGFANATGDIIATADADLTYPVEDIPTLVKLLQDDELDFITTNRFGYMPMNGNGHGNNGHVMSRRNWFGNYILALETRLLFGINIRDAESGMWIFRKHILDNLKLGSDSWPLSHELKIEACHFGKHRWREIPIEYRPRTGATNLSNAWKVGSTDFFHIMRKRILR